MTSVLLVVSSANVWTLKDGSKHPTGFWASEFIDPHIVFSQAGYDITIATPGGIAPTVDEFSLALPMNNNDQSSIDDQRSYLAALGTKLTQPVRLEDVEANDYDAVYVSGGHGPMEDLAGNKKIGEVFTTLLSGRDKVAAAVCHGVGALLPAHNQDGTWPFAGRKITGFTNEEETALGFGDKAPWLLESRLRAAGANFFAATAFGPHVIVDGNLITGQNPASAKPSAEAVVKTLSSVSTN
ncbi:type 1 glutamine amidotransferase domain-containing protein [Streptomyces sp. SID1121]|uniref:type 1 glutamine amidotransferase domain-containing protein n=1 Tax=Streptomyces sp. SID1121 TaxID=3425888 RepID=UPI0040570D22